MLAMLLVVVSVVLLLLGGGAHSTTALTTDAWFHQDGSDSGAPLLAVQGTRVARAGKRLRDRTAFSPYYSQMGSKNTDTVTVLTGPTVVALNRGQSPGRFWTVRLGSHHFTISIEDSTKLELREVTRRLEKLTEPYRRALEIVSEPGKNGIAFYSNLGGATAHGGQAYINIVPWGNEQVIAHEAGHVLEQRARNTEEDVLERWKDAIIADDVSVSGYGDRVAHEDQAEFALLWGVCYDAGNGRLNKLEKASPQRYALWETMMALSGVTIDNSTNTTTTVGPPLNTTTTPTSAPTAAPTTTPTTPTPPAQCPAMADGAETVFVTFESVGAISGEASLQDIQLDLQNGGGTYRSTTPSTAAPTTLPSTAAPTTLPSTYPFDPICGGALGNLCPSDKPICVNFECAAAPTTPPAQTTVPITATNTNTTATTTTLSTWDPSGSGWTIFSGGGSTWMTQYGYTRADDGGRFDVYGDNEGIYTAVNVTGKAGTLVLTFALKFGGESSNAARTYRASISIGGATATYETAVPCGSLVFQGTPAKPGHTEYRASTLQVVLGTAGPTLPPTAPPTPTPPACGTACNKRRGLRWMDSIEP